MYWYGSRWYDPALGRFLSPDAIVPGVGEGGNPNAIGYLGGGTYSPLTVDYHENQFLEQLNNENVLKLQDSDFQLPPVPTNTIAFDRYAYSLDNPIRYVDPSGHFAILAALALVPPAALVLLGVAAVATCVYFAVPEVRPAVTNAISEAGQSLSDALLQTKEDVIPDGLTKEQRKRWGQAAELYKSGITQPKGFQLPKELAEELADLIREGLSPEEAADELGELEDYMDK